VSGADAAPVRWSPIRRYDVRDGRWALAAERYLAAAGMRETQNAKVRGARQWRRVAVGSRGRDAKGEEAWREKCDRQRRQSRVQDAASSGLCVLLATSTTNDSGIGRGSPAPPTRSGSALPPQHGNTEESTRF